MNKVLIFLDSGQTIETYLNDNSVETMMKEIKKVIDEDRSMVIWVETDKAPELFVSTKNIVAIKVVWDVEKVLEKNNG